VIFYYKHKGLFKGITAVNDAINWDEDKHIEFTNYLILYELKRKQISVQEIADKVNTYAKEAYQLASKYIDDVFDIDGEMVGFTRSANQKQLQYIVNRRLKALGLEYMFPAVTESVFPWLEMTSLEGKTNFFEFDVPEYAKNNNMLPDHPGKDAGSNMLKGSEGTKRAITEIPIYSHDQYMGLISTIEAINEL
jgi:ribonucleotide reductase beta subunit family protein with ferritin-like domain